MCGRYAFFSPAEAVRRTFALDEVPELEPRYNIAPTQDVPAVRAGKEGARAFVMLHWGLVPKWAKERAIGNRMINARAETLAEKPSSRDAFRKRRCLVLADGWYEWQVTPGGKQPWFIRRKEAVPLAFAGVAFSNNEIPGPTHCQTRRPGVWLYSTERRGEQPWSLQTDRADSAASRPG